MEQLTTLFHICKAAIAITNTQLDHPFVHMGHVARMGEMRNACNTSVRKPEGKRPLGRSRDRWEDNIRMDLKEIGCEGVGWVHLVQDMDQWRPLVNTVMNLRAPQKEGNFLTS
jgi:hypothetical protein